MATAATSLLGLALPVTGELSGTWGDTVNTSITALLDSAVAGTTTLSADADVTLTTTTLAANQAREAIILWTAAGTLTRYITAPAQSKTYVVLNKSSTQSIVLRGVGPTTGVTVLAGKQAMVAWDGADFVEVSSGYVDGPASSTDNAIARFDGTDGKTIQNSVVTIADTTGNMAGVGTLGVGAITSSALTATRVPYAGTAGLIQDSANMTFSGTVLTSSFAGPVAATTLSASSTVSGTGFSTYLASPPAIGGTAPAAGTFTTLGGTTITASVQFSGPLNGTVGATTPNTGVFTNLSSTGNTTIGDAVADTITVNGQFVTGTVLKSAQALTNTLALAAYDVDGVAYTNLITLTASNTPTLALTSTGVGTINNMSIGATTTSTGAFTTLSASGVTTLSNLTASQAVFTDASKNLVSNAITGTGNVVMSTSPTLVTPALGTPTALVLTSATGLPLTTGVTGTLPVANGGTGQTTLATGALGYGQGTSAHAALAIGIGGQVLTVNVGATAPQWSSLSGITVTSFNGGTTGFTPNSATTGPVTLAGTLATTNGGTGLTSFTSGGVVYASSTSVLTTGSALTFNGTVLTSSFAGPVAATTLSSTGNTTLGDAVADTITLNGQFVTGTVLKSAQALTNTLALAAYDVDGLAYTNLITLTASNTPTLALTSTGVGTINNMSIGATTTSTGSFTTLAASSTVSGTGFSTYLASPPAIGGTAAAAGSFTALSYTTTLTGGTGIVNLGSGQFYKDASGNVGIGTSSPAYKLDVTGQGRATTGFAVSTDGSTFTPAGLNAIPNYGMGYITSTSQTALSGFGGIPFYTSATERARIDSSGNLLVGGSSIPGSGNVRSSIAAGQVCYTAYQSGTTTFMAFQVVNGNGEIGSITTSATTTSYNTSSDYRLKENIAPMTGALAKVALLKPCTYKWKVNGADGEGFIAHELAEVCPQAVTGEKDAVDADGKIVHQGIDVSFLVGTLTAAIQEQQALITALTQRLTALESK